MARVHEYKRSLDAVTTQCHTEKYQLKFGDMSMIRIKEEPRNINEEEICAIGNNESTKCVSVNMPENNYNKEETIFCLTKKNKDSTPDEIPTNKLNDTDNVCYSSEKKESRKRKQHERNSLVDTDDCKNMKAVNENDGIIKPYKRLKKTSESKKFNCKICFFEFANFLALCQHKASYEKKKRRPLEYEKSSKYKSRLHCNFCPQTFKKKRLLQSHLFHLHESDLSTDDKMNSSSIKLCNSHPNTPTTHMRQTTLLEYMFSPEKLECSETTNSLNNLNVHSQTIIKQEIDLNENESDLSMNTLAASTSLQNEISSRTTIPNQPFVKIHIHSTAMKLLLGIDQNDPTELSENNSQNNNDSGEIHASRSSSTLEPNNAKPSTISHKIESMNFGGKSEGRDLSSMCKKCSVILVRCDDKPITKLASQFNTPSTLNLGPNISSSQKRKRQQSKNRNVITTPKKAIPKDSSSTNSTPKGLSSYSFRSSKPTMPNFSATNNLSEQISNRQLDKRIASSKEEKLSSEKTNTTVLKDVSSQNKLDLTNIQSTQPKTELKLKELKVSLTKLSIIKIKKEVDETNIIYCEICELPFLSERKKDKHIRKVHTTYISSICTARFRSKRYMLKHYLKEHCVRGYNRCCVCHQFLRSRILLQRHLLLHCIKVKLSKDENELDMVAKCNVMRKHITWSRQNSMKRKKIADVGQENVNVNNIENIRIDNTVNQTNKCKANNDADAEKTDYEQEEYQINAPIHEMQNSLENNIIYLSSNDYEEMDSTKESASDPLTIINNSFITDNETRSTFASNTNTIVSTVSDKSVLVLPNVEGNNKQKYPCSICGKQFQKLEGLWQHKRTYTQSLSNFCTTCGLCFSNRKILRNHINTTHDGYIANLYKYHCQFCNQGFRSGTNLRIHELHYHASVETTSKQKVAELLRSSDFEKNLDISQTMCNICDRNFNNCERYRLHCMYYHKGHVFACHFCNQIFQGLYMLHHHKKSHHYPESTKLSYMYHCPICYEGFTIESHFHGHMAHVHSEKQHLASPNRALKSKKSYVCSKCHLEFSTIMELMVHVEHYTDGGNYQCQQCPRKCCSLAVLNEHINLSHDDKFGNNYKCGLCNEVLISGTSLLCHRKHVHQYVANSADFMFSHGIFNQNSGETEMNISDKVLPVMGEPESELVSSYNPLFGMNASTSRATTWGKCNVACAICGINFGSELYLEKHLTEYLNVGDYKCVTCQRCFASYKFLRKHEANHAKQGTTPSKYYCRVCNENFQSSIVYESHVAHLHARIFMADISSSNV